MLWQLVLFVDSQDPSHAQLAKVVSQMLPDNGSIEPNTRPIGRYYCAVWRSVTEEETKPFFFRLLQGDLKACRKFILECDETGVADAVNRCMASVTPSKPDPETMWVQLKTQQPREANFAN